METFSAFISSQAEWLAERAQSYIVAQGYQRQFTTLPQSWHHALTGISAALSDALGDPLPESPDAAPPPPHAPDSWLAASAAQLRRENGVPMGVFFGVLKELRRSYQELLQRGELETGLRHRAWRVLDAYFDRMELIFCGAWCEQAEGKALEELLRANLLLTAEKSRFQAVFQSMNEPALLVDRENRIQLINRAAALTFFGSQRCPRELGEIEPLEDELVAFHASDEQERLMERVLNTLGTPRRFQVKLKRTLDGINACDGTVVIMNDITEQSIGEIALRKAHNEMEQRVVDRTCDLAAANEQLRCEIKVRLAVEEELKLVKEFMIALMEHAPIPIVATDREHAYLLVNRAWEDATGLTREGVIGKKSCEIFPPEVVGLVNACNLEVIEGRRAHTFQELIDSPQGQRLYHTVKFPLFDHLGEVETVGAISIDITEKTCAEEMLRESEERYRNLVEFSTNAIYIAIDGRYVFSNKAGVSLLGASAPEEIVDRQVLDFIHPDYLDAEQERVRMLREDGLTPLAKEEKYIRLDGAVVDVDVAAIPFTFHDRSAILILAHDITERKKLEEELEKNARFESIGLLAGGIAHDFNNLLAAILGNISLSKLLTPEDAETYHLLAEAENASLRARDLTRQLLTFARGGAPVKKSVTVGELVKETCAFALRGSNVCCTFDIPEQLSTVEVDAGQISQVVQNLVMNADQAMPDGGAIAVVCENVAAGGGLPLQLNGKRYVRISISDTGHGIQADHLKRIFDPYFTTKQKGSGLGLATAFSIIKKHDGCIVAESERGKGSVFQIYLPASDAPQAPLPCQQPAPFVGKGRVLFMDDEEAVRFMAGRTLRRIGFEVVFAKDGLQAITLYREALAAGERFSAVVMDLTIPGGMGGKEAVVHLRELDPELKAFVSSGYSDDPVMADPQGYGFCGVIPKPFLYEEMVAALQQVFGNL
jgi:two-component system cell cycle sensor histidine kinase/response regulator CckA